jgi:hypothetical protein
MVFLTFLYASCKDSGTLKPHPTLSFMELLKDVNPMDLCPDCQVIRTARSRHCAICNQCIERFDHHCPWINNCVGIKNHNAFLMFLITIWLKISFHLYADMNSFVTLISLGNPAEHIGCLTDDCKMMCLGCDNIYVYFSSVGYCIIVCTIYFLLSSVLMVTHLKNYCSNRTTQERFSRGKKSNKKVKKTHEEVKDEANSQESSGDSSSIMSLSDFEITEDNASMVEGSGDNKETMIKK